jgi:hypothetical protein
MNDLINDYGFLRYEYMEMINNLSDRDKLRNFLLEFPDTRVINAIYFKNLSDERQNLFLTDKINKLSDLILRPKISGNLRKTRNKRLYYANVHIHEVNVYIGCYWLNQKYFYEDDLNYYIIENDLLIEKFDKETFFSTMNKLKEHIRHILDEAITKLNFNIKKIEQFIDKPKIDIIRK